MRYLYYPGYNLFLETIGAILVILSEKDLVNLMRLLQSYSTKWEMIGLSLGFIQCELKTISGMPKLFVGAPVSYLQELLSQWVQWPTEEHQNNPTLGALCTALRSSLVGLGSLAEEVEKEMKQCAAGKRCTKFNSHFLSPSFSFYLCITVFIRVEAAPRLVAPLK